MKSSGLASEVTLSTGPGWVIPSTSVHIPFPLSEIRAAISYLEAGHARGKVVITV
jgi:hypothetical protein